MSAGAHLPDDYDRSRGSSWASTIAASAATLTAIVAVFIAYVDNLQTRRHNRLSVMPFVVIERMQQDSAGFNRGSISISNEGVGPAILRGLEIRVRVDGRDTVVAYWSQAAPFIAGRGLQVRGWMDVDSGRALGVQRSGMLLRFVAEGDSANQRVQGFLDGLGLRLRYASIYGEEQEATMGEW